MSTTRLGPNPWIKNYATHVPILGKWAVGLSVFCAWPVVFAAAEKKGYWKC